jgi:hypothetical protein
MNQLQTMAGLDRTGMLTRLTKLQQALVDSSAEQLGELARKIAAGEPVILGPATTWACPHCGFHQPDTEFANGIVWRSNPEVPMTEHINLLHEHVGHLGEVNRTLGQRVVALSRQLAVLKKKARRKRSVASVKGRAASRGRSGSAKKGRR